jgi:iron complex outermembrane recepter protein
MSFRWKLALMTGGSLLALSGALPALAQSVQSTPPPSDASSSPELKSVVVTARHRVEKVQSVPVAITVVDRNQIKNLGSSNLTKIQQLVPTLTIEAFNPRNTSLNIRGLGSVPNLANDGLEGGVGTYIDGVLLSRPAQDVFDLPDIDSIEVLRGPQGTLFGKNTVAGAINIRTRLPSFTPEADYTASYGTEHYAQLGARVTSSVFGSDKLAFSLALQGTQHDGYVSNLTSNEHYANQNDKGIRAQLLYNATPNLTIRAIYDYEHQHSNCCVNEAIGYVSNYANGAALPNSKNINYLDGLLGYKIPYQSAFKRETDVNSPVYYDMETGGATLIADYNLSGYTLSSITGFRYWNWYPHNDLDSTALPALTASNMTDYQRQYSQELRLTSPLGKFVDYTGGLYFFYQSINDHLLQTLGSAAGTLLSGAAPGTGLNTIYTLATNGFSQAADGVYDTRSLAAYGQAVWHLTPQIDLTTGVRETYEAKTADYDQYQQGGVASTNATVRAIRNSISPYLHYGVGTANALPAGLVTLSYKPSSNVLTYATFSHGAKSAGINLITTSNALLVPKQVAPETDDNFEIGIKTTLFHNRLILDGDAFWDEDSDYQGTVFGTNGSLSYTYIASVPKVRSRGFEVDSRAQVTDNLSLFAAATYDDAYYESFHSGPCAVEFSNVRTSCDLTGRPVAGNSKWSGSVGGEYDQPLSPIYGRNLVAYVGGNVLLKTGFYSSMEDSQYGWVPGYALGNVNFGVRSESGRWDFSGWIHNVSNSKYYLYRGVSTTAAFPTYNLIYAQVGDPISAGITLSGKF